MASSAPPDPLLHNQDKVSKDKNTMGNENTKIRFHVLCFVFQNVSLFVQCHIITIMLCTGHQTVFMYIFVKRNEHR